MASIFISYNRESEAIAKSLADDIQALGHTEWFDQALSGGQAWWDQILAKIRACDVFLFVLNPESLNSTACKREYGYACELGKPILPLLVSADVSTTLLPPALSKIHFVDYQKQDRDAGFRLARALTTISPPDPLPDPLPAPPEVPISYLGSLTEQIETTSTLSYAEQSTLAVDLKKSLRDPETTDDARTLLERMRKRRDLYATIADEIDELLRSTRKATTSPRVSAMEPSSPAQSQKEERPLTLSEERLAERQKPQRSATPTAPSNADHKPTWRRRIIGSVSWAALGIILGLGVLGSNKFALSMGFLGAIAGGICGTDRRDILAALIGFALGFLIVNLFNNDFYAALGIGAPVGAILGSMVGLFLRGLRRGLN